MGIKAVVFDFGNVLSMPQGPETMGLLAAIAGVDEKTITDVVWKTRAEYDRGALTGADFYRGALAKVGVNLDEGSLAALVRADLESWANLNPETVKLADDAKAAGFKVGILSNMPLDFLALARKRFPIFKTVDAGIYSCELSVNKPEKAIYDALIAALGLSASEIVFFDDIEANVAGAKAVGINALLWKDAAQARKELSSLGVAV
jgi:putative hydrolase of the HAD superfamily